MAKTTPVTAQQKAGSAKKTSSKKAASSTKPAKLGGVPTQGQLKR